MIKKKNNENNNFEVEKENEDIRGESELKDNNIGNNDDLDELENENLSIINKNENDYNKLLELFESLDINENEEEAVQKSDWYKKSLNERVKLRGKAKNKSNKKKKKN